MCAFVPSIQGYHGSCNIFDVEKANQNSQLGRANSTLELERYLHCFQRYQNQSQGYQFAKEARDKFVLEQEDKE